MSQQEHFSDLFGVSVMFVWHFMSFARRSMSERILDDISEQTKPTRIPLVWYEEILICLFVQEYATLAINISLLQHSHLKLDKLDRKEQIFFARKPNSYSPVISKSARSRHYYIAKSARSRHYKLAKSARSRHYYLASDHTIHRAFKRALLKKMNVVDDVRI